LAGIEVEIELPKELVEAIETPSEVWPVVVVEP